MNLRAPYAATANRCAMFEHRTRISETSSLVQRALHSVRYCCNRRLIYRLPHALLRYFSRCAASFWLRQPSQHTSSNGTRFLVDVTNPLLCCCTRRSQPLSVVKSTFNFMKQFPGFATLAPASGGATPC